MLYSLDHLRKNHTAENPFIIYRTDLVEIIYTYKEILEFVNTILQEFRNSEIPRKCGIAVKLKNQHLTVTGCVLLLSILNHDCYFCPIHNVEDISLHGIEASYILTDERSDVEIIRANNTRSFHVLQDEGEVILIKLLDTKASQNEGEWCYCIGTTGSTGRPKLVYVPYQSIDANVLSLSSKFQMTRRDVIFLAAPLTFDPFVIEFFMALHTGAALLLTSKTIRQTPTKLVDILCPCNEGQVGVTLIQTTPSMFRCFGVVAVRDVILAEKSSLRILILGGESFPKATELKSWLPNGTTDKKFYNIYGITEISCWSLICEINLKSIAADEDIPLGCAIEADTKVQIVQENGDVLNGPGLGELLLGSSTRKCFIPQVDTNYSACLDKEVVYRSTGDLVERSENDNIYYKGRLNDTIKRFGKRLSLDALSWKVENILAKLVNPKVVCLWSDSNKKLICCLAYHGSVVSKLKISQLIMSNELLEHEKPDSIIHKDVLPLNKHGKIDRRKLLEETVQATAEPLKPLDIFHKFLKESLGIPIEPHEETPNEISLHKKSKNHWSASFAALGGTSYQALSLSLAIGELLLNQDDQRKFLELLMHPNETLLSIWQFLKDASIKDSFLEQPQNLVEFEKKFRFCWRKDFGKCVDSSPALVQGQFICVGSHSHSMRTVHSASGEDVMHLKLPDRIECPVEFVPGDGENLAFVGCYDGHLYAFDVIEGSIKWHVNVGGMIKAKPLWLQHEHSVIVACYGEEFNVWCLGYKQPHVKWHLKLGSKGIFASPVQSTRHNCVYVCSLDGSYACLEPKQGSIRWSQRFKSPIFSTPALIKDDSLLVVAEVNGNLHICSALNGVVLQTFTADGNIFSSISVHTSNPNEYSILFGCHDGHVYCLKFSQHNQLTLCWRTCLNAAVYATPLILQLHGELFVVAISTKGRLQLMDEGSGSVNASYELEGEVFSSPCCSADGDKVYFGCRDNFLYCFQVG